MSYYTWKDEEKMVGKEQEEMEKEGTVLTLAEYEEGLRNGKLLGLRCASCGGITCHPMPVCQWCGGRNLKRMELCGEGELTTFTVIRVPSEGFEEDAPYIPCLVKTKEGPYVVGRLDYDPEHATQELIGKRVKMNGTYTYKGDKFSGGAHTCPVFEIQE